MIIEIKPENLLKTERTSNLIEQCVCIMGSVFNGGCEQVQELLENENAQKTVDIVSEFGEALYDASDVVGAVQILKAIVDIPTQLFRRKFERYCRGLEDIPIDKKEAYLKKIGKKSFNTNSVFILEIINRIEEADKIDMLLKLLRAKIYDEIDDVAYRRLVLMVSRTLYSDLIYLADDIKGDNFIITTDEQEGLLGNGWIRNLGAGFLSDDTRESSTLFAYNRSAKLFCKIVFNSDIAVVPPNDTGIITLAEAQDIANLFS